MGGLIHKEQTLFQKLFSKIELNAIILGLDNAGKSTLLRRLKLGQIYSTNVEFVKFKKVKFTTWDLFASQKLAPLFQYCYKGVQGFIYVVDLADKERIQLASQLLHKQLKKPELNNASLLVFGNKSDIKVMNIEQMTEILGLNKIIDRRWKVQECSSMSGDGILEGLQWLCDEVSRNK